MASAGVVCTTTNRLARLPGLRYGDDFRALVMLVALGAAVFVVVDAFVQRVMKREATA